MVKPKANTEITTVEAHEVSTEFAIPQNLPTNGMLLHDPEKALAVAQTLQRFVTEKKLTSSIQGKQFAQVGAWQFAGTMIGLTARVIECVEDLRPGVSFVIPNSTIPPIDYIGYDACVVLEDHSGRERGRGYAHCDNLPSDKKNYARFAVMSMAQTRAVSKAYRNTLGWLMQAAGFEATPAEEVTNEMRGDTTTQPAPLAAPQRPAQQPLQPSTEFDTPAEPEIKYASAKQKEEIIRLLNNEVITRAEKTKMLLNINKLDEERAQQSIDKLKKAIEGREAELAKNTEALRDETAGDPYGANGLK